MERPALARLLGEAEFGKIDVVVVYKVDRLTRSLADFARIVELFDARGVSFVSVTQQFNTTSSMGRLTLNVLLSFGQFEREVTGERIRDKIAASKRKGLWMGGFVPLGYDARDKKLVINAVEAETVRTLFRLYRELGTVPQLQVEAERLGLLTRRRANSSGRATGGGPFTRGHLYQLLSNPIYAGTVTHKGSSYPGRHEAIIDPDTFDAVQRQLAGNAPLRHSLTNAKAPSLLAGLIYDERGDRLCSTHANKKGRRYRYYISKRLVHRTGPTVDGWRLPAKEPEGAVLQIVRDLLKDEVRLLEALNITDAAPNQLRKSIAQAGSVADELEDAPFERRRQLLSALLHSATICPNSLCVRIKRASLAAMLSAPGDKSVEGSEELFECIVSMQLKRRGAEAKLAIQAAHDKPLPPDVKLLSLLADAHRWVDDLAQGRATSVQDLARQDNRDPSEVSRALPLAFLAPDIIKAILEGRQPLDLTPHQLKRVALPLRWDDQRRRLGFAVQSRSEAAMSA